MRASISHLFARIASATSSALAGQRARALARRRRLQVLAFALLTSLIAHRFVRAEDVAAALYVRTDTDQTTVISPRTRAQKQFDENTSADVTYAADIWTSASIDIRASASKRPVTEQRDELDVGVTHAWTDVTLHGGYRFSSEHDYSSHGASLGLAYDFADNAARLEAGLHAFVDRVGQSGNPHFARPVGTVDGTLSFTQVLDPMMYAQLTYELAHIEGYQASPYRFVGVGGTGFGCIDASLCLPERVPGARTRHAFALQMRRALSDAFSVGLTYRYYLDDWALRSHTVLGEFGWNVGQHTLLAARYRFYTQGGVEFYQARYAALTADQFRTRDRELSPLNYHRAGIELEHSFELADEQSSLIASLAVSGNLYHYPNFVGLTEIVALEISAGVLLELLP